MSFARNLALGLSLSLGLLIAAPQPLHAQDQSPRRARKYKAPPATSHIEVLVTKGYNGKPIQNAAVVFNPFKDGKDIGSLELKTDPEGKAIIDVIPTGSLVRIQVLADGFATFGQDFQIDEATRSIAVVMQRPREQISTYVDTHGEASHRAAGVQEPVHSDDQKAPTQPATTPAATKPTASAAGAQK
ncbi:MAG: hypothetical protein KGK08_03150 [Acidobacteriota bacterium]|nr:hypothetical protein [Acidobacteriota bacterium]